MEPHQDGCLGKMKTLRCHSVWSSIWPHWLLHYKIMIVCLFGRITFLRLERALHWHQHQPPPPPPHLYPVYAHHCVSHKFIHNLQLFIFSVIQIQEHSNKRGIKLGLFSHFKNKNDTMSVFRLYHRNHTNDYLAGHVKKTKYLIFHLHI